MKALSVLLFGLALGISTPALAVYKCEADGKITYGDTPCPGGKILETAIPSSTDAREADRTAARERKALAKLENARHKREAAEERDLKSANRAAAAKQKRCDSFARRQKRADDVVRTSVGKANERAKMKARSIAEDYETACGRWPDRELGMAR